MPKRSATRRVTRGILCAASVFIFPVFRCRRWHKGLRVNNQPAEHPQPQLSTEQPLRRLPPRVSSRPPFALSRVIIQARCTVIIGGTTTAMSAISRVIISWSHPIIASINWLQSQRPLLFRDCRDVLLSRTPSNTHLACCLPPVTTIDFVNFLPRVWRQSPPVCIHAGGGTKAHVPVAMRSESQLAAAMVTA
jgi:hypothetical protein